MARQGKAYWIINLIASYQPTHKDKPFQIWELKVKDREGVMSMKEDTTRPELVRQVIPFTDFPLEYLKLYCIDGVILLPSEY
jgi:hypothetical protein